MHAQRPVNLGLSTILQQPLPAITSITHRITGVLIFFGMGYFFWLLDRALASPDSLERVREAMAAPSAKLSLLVVLAALAFHIVAGIRHLLLDVHVGDNLKSGRAGAGATFAITGVVVLLAVYWIW